MQPDHSIGIFDSGIGGLTVFQEVAEQLPSENLIYLGDTARVPYGSKSAETVKRYALENVQFLMQQKVKMAVVACNTASAFALSELEKKFPIPILGVIEPGVKGALRVSKQKRIGVIGTEGTIRSGAYAHLLRMLEPSAQVISISCPLFVPLVEEGWLEGEIVEKIAKRYFQKMLKAKIDTLILGCTHYPLLKKTLRKVMGRSVTLIDSAEEITKTISSILQREGLARSDKKQGRRQFFVTDSVERFQRIGSVFLKETLMDVKHVEI